MLLDGAWAGAPQGLRRTARTWGFYPSSAAPAHLVLDVDPAAVRLPAAASPGLLRGAFTPPPLSSTWAFPVSDVDGLRRALAARGVPESDLLLEGHAAPTPFPVTTVGHAPTRAELHVLTVATPTVPAPAPRWELAALAAAYVVLALGAAVAAAGRYLAAQGEAEALGRVVPYGVLALVVAGGWVGALRAKRAPRRAGISGRGSSARR